MTAHRGILHQLAPCFMAVVFLVGCARTDVSSVSRLLATPDGRHVLYLVHDRCYVQRGPEPVAMRQRVSLHWTPARERGDEHSLLVASAGSEQSRSSLAGQVHLAISPDSRRACVVTPAELLVVDLRTQDIVRLDLGDMTVTSVCWLDRQHIAYVTHACGAGQPHGAGTLTVWRQGADGAAGPQRLMECPSTDCACQRSLEEGYGWPKEYWSPDGRFVVMPGCRGTTGPRLFTPASGSMRSLGGATQWLVHALWSSDGGKLLYVTSDGDSFHTFLDSPGGGPKAELTPRARAFFGRSVPFQGARWTADGQFVVGSKLETGGYLINPEPWAIAPLRLPGTAAGTQPAEPWDLEAQSAPGLVLASRDRARLVVNYRGELVVRLPDVADALWLVLPGGDCAVGVGDGGVHRVAMEPGTFTPGRR